MGETRPVKVNSILHTAWLDDNALTLKSNTAKYYFGEKSSLKLKIEKNINEDVFITNKKNIL